eukprot:CAMPEP_0119508574 /NCGR_PEP_ID=MMETSP1344-20130328/28141_1 /TAXON_ID=236787 /ORGANISM="Florenciella parvula, Strain CCMP2471" /LENGTH=79 /DNA_ID=CAMNT_0007545325 /DNA_START=225 /DNA_END=461 /DNA_ORIENTATION=-
MQRGAAHPIHHSTAVLAELCDQRPGGFELGQPTCFLSGGVGGAPARRWLRERGNEAPLQMSVVLSAFQRRAVGAVGCGG